MTALKHTHTHTLKTPHPLPLRLPPQVVLATGIQGGGEWHIPSFVTEAGIPRSLYAHTSEAVDFDALKGKRIAILGGGQLWGGKEIFREALLESPFAVFQ